MNEYWFNLLPDDLQSICDPRFKLPKINKKLLYNPNIKKINKAIDILIKICNSKICTRDCHNFKISKLVLFYKLYCRWYTSFEYESSTPTIINKKNDYKNYTRHLICNLCPLLDKKEIIILMISLFNSSSISIIKLINNINLFLSSVSINRHWTVNDNTSEIGTREYLTYLFISICTIPDLDNITFKLYVNNFVDNILLNIPDLNFKEELDNIIHYVIKNNVSKICKIMYNDLESMKIFY